MRIIVLVADTASIALSRPAAAQNTSPVDSKADSPPPNLTSNIFDVDARRASSFLKDFEPLAGRDIRVIARIGF